MQAFLFLLLKRRWQPKERENLCEQIKFSLLVSFVKLHSLIGDFLIALVVNDFVSYSHMFYRIFNS